ncbi:MAG: tRNA epoxyqueuosine(34) reductase QueG [Terriglobia bacterium]
MNPSQFLKARAIALGFDLVGIAPADALPDLEFSRQWVAAGNGGQMTYLANPKRDDPRCVLPSVQSVVCAALVYNTPLPYSTEMRAEADENPQAPAPPRAWISRYAWGADYHEVMRAKLELLRGEIELLGERIETRVYVDTGPIVERAFARYSGIGWTGKNTCLISQQKGSWFFLGVILTNLALAPDLPAPDRCGSCTRCLDACPTGALTASYVMDASRCIAYFTIELKGSIPQEFRPAIGNNVYGCDICQDVCPWNSVSEVRSSISRRSSSAAPRREAATTERPEFQPLRIDAAQEETREAPPPRARHTPPRFSLFNPPLAALASIGEDQFRRVFARSPIKRAKFRGWLRNLCVAIGNSGDPSFIPWLRRISGCGDEIIREHADWALQRLHAPAQAVERR